MEIIKNRVKDLTEDQRNIVLESDPIFTARGFVGKTLGEFIEHQLLENATLTELYEEMSVWHLKWPFRLLKVTVEATVSRGYDIAVIDDETIDAFAKGEIEQLNELDPKFNLETAYDEALSDWMDGYVNYDYAVEDDTGRKILDWDD